jgi:hypothetical protein
MLTNMLPLSGDIPVHTCRLQRALVVDLRRWGDDSPSAFVVANLFTPGREMTGFDGSRVIR